MKKMIVVLAAVAIGIGASAQEPVIYRASSYNTYNVPEPILIKFQNTYPSSAMTTTWTPMNGYWRATYPGANNNVVHVYYSMEPYYLVPVPDRVAGYTFSLPVTNTFVPDHIKTAAVNKYGASLYSITKMRAADDAEIYQVALLENGTLRYVWLNSNSMAFTDEANMKAGEK